MVAYTTKLMIIMGVLMVCHTALWQGVACLLSIVNKRTLTKDTGCQKGGDIPEYRIFRTLLIVKRR